MFALIFVPFMLLWTADNHEFLEMMTEAEWEYVAYQERAPGPQPGGSYAVTLESDGKTFILFKQRPLEKKVQLAGVSE